MSRYKPQEGILREGYDPKAMLLVFASQTAYLREREKLLEYEENRHPTMFVLLTVEEVELLAEAHHNSPNPVLRVLAEQLRVAHDSYKITPEP